ncbi:hypothetical protein HMPREF3226_01753 [Prevotella corporis]|uniref:Uncharacterized protein n=1 Tax=Prevotella corporis TaxID=28128 RepID=A0A133Q2N3_9BACT|nr:hypothetical protein HMPREF3226_01753 [Prevotella corporis]
MLPRLLVSGIFYENFPINIPPLLKSTADNYHYLAEKLPCRLK